MPTPGAGITNIEAAVDPTATDDNSEALDVGSRWINTTTGRVWRCVDNTVGAAIWRRVSNLLNNATTSNPTTANDNTQGYEVGSWWLNTTTNRRFVALDVSTGAAVWSTDIPQGGHAARNNFTATTDPMVSNDNTQGYSVGSVWVNTTASPRTLYRCLDASTGAAIWLQTTNDIANSDSPGLYFLGSPLSYSSAAGITAGEIQYARVFLVAGLSLSNIQVFVDSGGSAGRNIRVGIYDQADPTNITGEPNNRVAQSNSVTTDGTNGTYYTIPLTSTYVVTVTGYYWLAVVLDNAAVKLVVTGAVYRENYPPVRRESGTGTTLPATASGLTNPASAIAFVAATE